MVKCIRCRYAKMLGDWGKESFMIFCVKQGLFLDPFKPRNCSEYFEVDVMDYVGRLIKAERAEASRKARRPRRRKRKKGNVTSRKTVRKRAQEEGAG